MWQFIRSRILTVIIFIGAAHGILVVGPKFIRANQNYTVVISNFKTSLSSGGLVKLRMSGHTDDGRNVLNITKLVDVQRYKNSLVDFNMPKNLSPGNYRITINGESDFLFYMEAKLVYLSTNMHGLIQIDKPVFKPGDAVHFRVIVLDTELKPPARVKSVHVTIRDQGERMVQEWSSAELYSGVFDSELQLAPSAVLGKWHISVLVDGEVLASKAFEVKKSMLPSFDVEVIPPAIPLEEHQGLNLTITANYHVRNPVKGLVKVELFLKDNKLDQTKEYEMYGMKQVELRFVEPLKIDEDETEVFVMTTFIEQNTNRTVKVQSQITVYKYPYRAQLIKETPPFRPGLPFKCALQFRYHDGTPAAGITGKVDIIDIEYEATATSDDKGLIRLELNPSGKLEHMYITFSNDNDGFYFYERVDNKLTKANDYIKLELRSPIKLNRLMQFVVTSSESMTFFVYYIVSLEGNIIGSGFMRLNQQNKYPLRLMATKQMMPKAKVIVATEVKQTVVYDFVDIDFKDLRNNFNLSLVRQEAEPQQHIELRMSGRPGAYVGLAAHSKNHDPFWEDIMRAYNGFGSYDKDEFNNFHNMGLFATTLYNIKFNEAHEMAARYELKINDPITKLESNRTNISESWLWQNVSFGTSGTQKIIEAVPDTTTSWYLTGFSIDREYGLSIIRNPIKFTTMQPIYIVENLPHSIKRGEAVELQFTLFNNLEEEYIADVTLYNVANQTEFIGRPVEDLSYTKSVSIPPKVGVPILFPVKVRSLGEMTVRVKATILAGQVTDALEKVIRVMPESLVQSKVDSWFFCHDTYTNHTFRKTLETIPNADNGSTKVKFQLNPNLLTTVIDYLYDLIYDPSGNGEQTMVNLVPNLMVLDYSHAIGSRHKMVIDEATSLSWDGYQNLKRYRQTDGSFGVWKNNGSTVFLTAFVAKAMQTAAKYISEVDVAMVEKAYDWLASKQHISGRFDEIGPAYRKDMQGSLRDGVRLTSFVVTALLENENAKVKHAAVIERAMDYLSSQVDSFDDPYDLSIATYALMLNGHNMKDKAFKKLIDMSRFVYDGRQQYWDAESSVEATGYALLSFVIAEKYVDSIPVMNWLLDHRYDRPSFQNTQGTFVGLTALTKLAEKISPARNEYDMQVKFKKVTNHFIINSQNKDIVRGVDIPEDTESLEINFAGVGVGLLEVMYEYGLNILHFEHRFNLDLEKQTTNSSYELQLKVCVSFIPDVINRESPVVIVEVTFPSGYDVDPNPISEQTSINPIRRTDIRFANTSVLVYYGSMEQEQNCFIATAYRRGKVAMKRPAYVVVYDHFKPKFNAIKTYEVDEDN